ncbi:MAG: Pvc16 family protein [Pyrinomonadaceae bacterium]
MSNHLAIATVTASLAEVLQGVVAKDVAGLTVTTTRPDSANAAPAGTRLNIYLYQVTPNAAWRNSDLPTRADDGRLMQKPRVALDLHYLLTFYGNEAQLEPQRMLGSTVRALHSRPVLTREQIRRTIVSPQLTFLALSNLAEDIELVKFTPTSLSLEELSKLWAVFFQTQYTLSITYQGTVVLIETDDTAGPTLPVLERNVYTVPFRAPIIEEIKLDSPVAGPITPLSTIVIKGRALRADVIQIKFGGSKLPAVIPTFVADNELKVVVPPDLRAGIQGLQVQQQFLMGSPATPHRGFESNVGPFVLAPSITQPNAPTFAQTSIDPNTQLLSGDITVNFTPKITKPQRVKLLLNEFHSPTTRAPFGHVLAAPRQNGIGANDQETDTVVFKVKDVAAGDYLVRVQVDGAESPLERDTDPNSQTFNEFIGPRITI